tara:strand:+ start:246 stop:473 length:228 start_codon:yes stop_codon:yes gene_type:complete
MDGDRDPDIDMQLDLICGDIKAHALGKMVPLRGKGQRAEVDKNKNATDDAGKSKSNIEGAISRYLWCFVSCGVVH